jgi:hypothetical protein
VLEVKNILKASEVTRLSPHTQGHSISRHQEISELEMVFRQLNNPNMNVSAFADGRGLSDQFVAVCFLINSRSGQEALGVLDLFDKYLLVNKKGYQFTRVRVTGDIDTGPHMQIPQRRIQVAPGRVPAMKESVAKNISLVLELPAPGFGKPFYVVTGFPNDRTGINEVNPTAAVAKNWIKKQHGTIV